MQMVHLSENSKRLTIIEERMHSPEADLEQLADFTGVCVLRFASSKHVNPDTRLRDAETLVTRVVNKLASDATLIILADPQNLAHLHPKISTSLQYQMWIAIKRNPIWIDTALGLLPLHHFGALVYTGYKSSLRHTKTRLAYTFCPACDRTTKDYGGKKHTYHQYGTLLSDVWRDLECDLDVDISSVLDRLADLFGVEPYEELRVLDCRPIGLSTVQESTGEIKETLGTFTNFLSIGSNQGSKLIQGDVLEELRLLPDNSIDFAFADPPYNLKKKYTGYADDRETADYFTWCNAWLSELSRVLKPGRTCAVLNIPILAMQHFLHMETELEFQNWIVWDALSFPVRLIMPAHYAILCFSKGKPRAIPGLIAMNKDKCDEERDLTTSALRPLGEGFCLRSDCVRTRRALGIDDTGPLTDLWWDIHRLKHNSRRVDHPCQLQPPLMYRLISLFTELGESVLDPFNGAGTTTLSAHQLGRAYIGIELATKYHDIAQERHHEIEQGLDPFRKEERVLTSKNSPVARMLKQTYEVPKKTLQLEVRRVAMELGHIPNRDELSQYGKYPIRYYDEYFLSWGEVSAAARTTGMSEMRGSLDSIDPPKQLQLSVLFDESGEH